MTKKERTGLQSKISHIFSGVPVPKKSRPADGESIAAPKPEESNITQMPVAADDAVEWNIEPQADIGSSVTEQTVSEIQSAPQTPIEETSKQTEPAEEIPVEQDTENKTQNIEYSTPQSVAGAEVDSSLDISKESPYIEPPVKTPVHAPAFVIERKTAPSAARKSAQRLKVKTRTNRPKADAAQRRQKVQLAVLIGLSILLVFILFNPFKVSSRAVSPAGTDQKGMTPTTGTDNAITKVNWPAPPDYPENITDPMDTASVRPVEPQSLRPIVSGITYSDDKPQVIIGTQLVGEGEQINGTTVVKINKDSVEFEKDGEKWIQQIHNEK